MGMYSYLDYHDLELVGSKDESIKIREFITFVKDLATHCPKYIPDTVRSHFISEAELLHGKLEGDATDIEKIAYALFDDMKIISYWYEGYLYLLREVAQYLSGTAKLNFETNDEFAEINFEDGEASVKTGQVVWGDFEDVDTFSSLTPLPDDAKVLRKL